MCKIILFSSVIEKQEANRDSKVGKKCKIHEP
jgi:hypothetical protein